MELKTKNKNKKITEITGLMSLLERTLVTLNKANVI